MRLFIGAALGDAALGTLQETAVLLARRTRGGFARRDMYHITLAFLGDTDADRLDTLAKTMDAAARREKFSLRLDGLGFFGKPDSAILYCGVERSDALERCSAELRALLTREGVAFDAKPFKAHITLARKADSTALQGVSVSPALFCVEGLTLFHSARINGTLTYTPIYFSEFAK